MFRQWLHDILAQHYPGHFFDVLVPPDAKMGDYSTNIAMAIAKKEKRPPQEVALEVCAVLREANDGRMGSCEVAGPGFVNVVVADDWLQKHFEKTTPPQEGAKKKVVIEYPSTNIAKPMHAGHARPAFIGDALARVHEALGYDVVRWDHLGDWGTQFGMIIAAYKKWGDEKTLEEKPLVALNDLYVRYQAEAKTNEALLDHAREEFKKLEAGDDENTTLWKRFSKLSLEESHRMYERLGLLPSQREIGESEYVPKLPTLVRELQDAGIASESEGAVIVDLEAFSLPPALIQKSDGASVYLTRDIASLKQRIETEQPNRILYVVANQQALHLEQLFAIGQLMKLASTELVHVKFGLVLGEDGKKLSTREGTAVLLEDIVEKVVALAENVVRTKNDALSEDDIRRVAHAVGIGALKYNDLRQHPHTDIVFDWDAMLDIGGNSGPYIQYTYARLSSILRKAENIGTASTWNLLTHATERALMRHLLDYGYAVSQCAKRYALNGLALYLHELAELANRYYEQVRINDDEDADRRATRLHFIQHIKGVLKEGLDLLGIQALERI